MSKRLNSTLQLIYAGGTFGSYGKPLDTLPADTFVPLLLNILDKPVQQQSFGAMASNTILSPVEALPNECVKDSSQLTPLDFAYFYELILKRYADGYRQYILITGTDTLSYLGAWLAEAFASSDICIVLTASMRPLFDADNIGDYQVDANSDAWENLSDAIGLAAYGEPGVYIAFAGESWPAQTVQKIHSHDLMAFTGHQRAGYPANSYVKKLSPARRRNWIEDNLEQSSFIQQASTTANVATIYCVPNNLGWLVAQLQALMDQVPMGIILIGFGSGNVPYSEKLATILDALYKQGHMVICTTQTPYGGVSEAYAAGSWQYKHHVISGGRLTIPAIYGRLLWLHVAYNSPARRRARWKNSISKTQIGINQ